MSEQQLTLVLAPLVFGLGMALALALCERIARRKGSR